ncbi:hypothetical protein VNO80_07354 [Phaseolus coccineus]|uniref:Uncharacterized protein n=1 Tax=Phaseolus coccineus TaxID=3886 RepID=A0AAN9NJK2_PHACN
MEVAVKVKCLCGNLYKRKNCIALSLQALSRGRKRICIYGKGLGRLQTLELFSFFLFWTAIGRDTSSWFWFPFQSGAMLLFFVFPGFCLVVAEGSLPRHRFDQSFGFLNSVWMQDFCKSRCRLVYASFTLVFGTVKVLS